MQPIMASTSSTNPMAAHAADGTETDLPQFGQQALFWPAQPPRTRIALPQPGHSTSIICVPFPCCPKRTARGRVTSRRGIRAGEETTKRLQRRRTGTTRDQDLALPIVAIDPA